MAEVFDKIMVIIVTAVLMFIVPVLLVANRLDQSAQSYMDRAVISFVDDIRVMGKITPEAYEKLVKSLDEVQTCCDVDIVVSCKEVISDETGEIFAYYRDMYKSELLEAMYTEAGRKNVYLSNGDYIKVTVKTTQPTVAQRMLSVSEYVPLYVTYGGWVRSSG